MCNFIIIDKWHVIKLYVLIYKLYMFANQFLFLAHFDEIF